MSKFHINKHGVPAPCRATKGNCPLGGDDTHFDSTEEAQAYIDGQNETEHSILPGVRDIDSAEVTNFEIDGGDHEGVLPDSYDVPGFQVNWLSKDDIREDPEWTEQLKDVVAKADAEHGDKWVLVKEGNLDNYINFNMRGHSGGEPVTKEDLLAKSNFSINGEKIYVGTPADFAYEAEGGSFKVDKDDFDHAFPDTYIVHGYSRTGVGIHDFNDEPELKEKMADVINYVESEYPDKKDWVLVKEGNLDDFVKYNMRKPEIDSKELIEDSEFYINGERMYVADVSDIDPESY